MRNFFGKAVLGSLFASVPAVCALAVFAGFGVPAAAQAGASQGPGLVDRALQAEIAAQQDASHPMRYRLRKSSPRLTTTKELIETRDGQVALLVEVNDSVPSAEDAEKERARLDALLADPGKQRHRKQSEDADAGRAMKVLRALPKAFFYQDAGPKVTAAGTLERYTFTPNPKFNPPDLETTVLTQMVGEIWVDTARGRVAHLEGHLQEDVDFGWGVLGRLYKGGSVAIDQADVGGGVWRIVRFRMVMSGRVLFKTRSFDTVEEESHFQPVPASLDYRQAIQMLRSGSQGTVAGAR